MERNGQTAIFSREPFETAQMFLFAVLYLEMDFESFVLIVSARVFYRRFVSLVKLEPALVDLANSLHRISQAGESTNLSK